MTADPDRRERLLAAIDDEGGHVAAEDVLLSVERMIDAAQASRGRQLRLDLPEERRRDVPPLPGRG